MRRSEGVPEEWEVKTLKEITSILGDGLHGTPQYSDDGEYHFIKGNNLNNGTLGNVAFYNNEKIILGKSACYFNLLDGIDKFFIKYILVSPQLIKYLHTKATGATIKNVSLKSMREYKINLPNLKEQKAIVLIVNNLSSKSKKLIQNYYQKVSDLDELKKSILQKAFSGELTKKDIIR